MTAYISVSYSQRKLADKALTAIRQTLNGLAIIPFMFVDNYSFRPAQEREMMRHAMADIDRCDILIAETSYKAIGIGIEPGYAKAGGKPVIYIRKKEAEHSTTLSGVSDFQIVYEDTNDLQRQLAGIIDKITTKDENKYR